MEVDDRKILEAIAVVGSLVYCIVKIYERGKMVHARDIEAKERGIVIVKDDDAVTK